MPFLQANSGVALFLKSNSLPLMILRLFLNQHRGLNNFFLKLLASGSISSCAIR